MSTYWNGSVFSDDSFIPNYTSFNNQSNYFVQSSLTHSDNGSLNFIPTSITSLTYQIANGTYFLASSTNKTINLPSPVSQMTYSDGSSVPADTQGSRFLIISDVGLTGTHLISTLDGTKLNGLPSLTLQPKQTIQLIFNGSQWTVLSVYPVTAVNVSV